MAANPNPSRMTDQTWYLIEELLKLSPGSKNGGSYADKPGYHNTRNNNSPYDYSVVDHPPDQGGPGDKCAAVDWTFPDAQGGDYSTISKYTTRLLKSAQDLNDPRLDGWREFYGNSDWDSYVEGWDCRYGCQATSDSSHLWHIHLSEDRDKVGSRSNKDNLLSVLRGETVEEWGDDVSAKDVWSFDVDPSSPGSYSASGALWTTFNRTGVLTNEVFAGAPARWAQDVSSQLATIQQLLAGGGGGGEPCVDEASVHRIVRDELRNLLYTLLSELDTSYVLPDDAPPDGVR